MPQFTDKEMNHMQVLQQKKVAPQDIHSKIVRQRARKGSHGPDVTSVRRFLKGLTHQRGKPETRGRKRAYSRKHVLKMERVRKVLLKKAGNQREVRWEDVRRRSRVPKATRTTLKAAFQREGLDVVMNEGAPKIRRRRWRMSTNTRRAFARLPSPCPSLW